MNLDKEFDNYISLRCTCHFHYHIVATQRLTLLSTIGSIYKFFKWMHQSNRKPQNL